MTNYLEQAKTHIDRGETDAAINNLIEHLDTDFNSAPALMMLGAMFQAKGHAGIAATCAKQAIEAHKAMTGEPYAEALNNLGVALKSEHHTEAAKSVWQLALRAEKIASERGKVLANLAGCEVHSGHPEKALEIYDRAMKDLPGNSQLLYDRSLALLEMGRWQEGWEGFEHGFHCGHRRNRRYRDLPNWDGTPDQTVIVWGEQGIGDEILFASCLPDMIQRCKKVIFDCHPRLVELFRRSFPEIEIYGTRKMLSGADWMDTVEADASVCLSSLPMHFRNRDEDFPGKAFLEANLTPVIGNGIGCYSPKPRIGISWAGGTKMTRADLRSIPLEQWLPIFEAVDADFYSLQYTPNAAKEVCELEEATGIHIKHYPGWVQAVDYDKTASFVASMDLVITVATAAHHLANGLGVPTWTLCSSRPSWRYTSHARVFYHQSNRQFRQSGNDWASVIDEVAAALKMRFQKPYLAQGNAS